MSQDHVEIQQPTEPFDPVPISPCHVRRAEDVGMLASLGLEETKVNNMPEEKGSAHEGANLDPPQAQESSCDPAGSSQTLPNDTPMPKRRGRQRKVPPTPPPVSQANETPTPQKKRGRKSKAELLAVAKAMEQKAPVVFEDEDDTEETPSGRPRRRAAKVARKFLNSIAKELGITHDEAKGEHIQTEPDVPVPPTPKPGRGRGRKTKAADCNSYEDTDFVPDVGNEVESEEGPSEEDLASGSDAEQPAKAAQSRRSQGRVPDGSVDMRSMWCCTNENKEFREEHCSSWSFPEWLPSTKDWCFLSASDAEGYLPQTQTSPTFQFSREGDQSDQTLYRLDRFKALPPHPFRWDSIFFVGGPVWSLEWCPCPDGAIGHQYAAIYCHCDMDERHKITGVYTKPTLLQVWDMGMLTYNSCPAAAPRLAVALAMEEGCIWDMKWCPSGAWELPSTTRKAPHMPRLGLLAVGFSSASIAIYSLPHPEAVETYRKSCVKAECSAEPPICKVRSVAVLKLGSIQADHGGRSGHCFCLDWLPLRPHNILAAGFYDGTVSLWNLGSRSVLQRVLSPGGQVTLYPYHTFTAHDHVVRAIAWCRASSDLLATAGDDRKLKLWDLRKTYEPMNTLKRNLTRELCWPLSWSGVFVAQECSYAPYGQHGIHFLESGYLGFKPFYAAPRHTTVWSISFSDWLNTCLASDCSGELIMVLLPKLSANPGSIKRLQNRRFPVYWTEMVKIDTDETNKADGIGCALNGHVRHPEGYSDAVKKYYLLFHDMDLRTLKNVWEQSPVKHMQDTELKGQLQLDRMPLESLHTVRFNPNLGSQNWVVSAGHSGLVRLHCLRALNSPVIDKMVQESQAQFSAMFPSQEGAGSQNAVTTVHSTESTVEVT